MISSSSIARKINSGEGSFESVIQDAIPAIPIRGEADIKEETWEQTTRLVRQVFIGGSTTPQVVVFAGVEHHAGCTWICARTADILAQHCAGRICAVDADFRSPSLYRHFKPGLPQDTKSVMPGSNLWLLSPPLATTHAPYSFERLRSQISELRRSFTHILIDAPPINAHSDAVLLSEVADGLVMILEANDTRREAALKAKESLNISGTRLLGAVLNKRTFPIPQKLYERL